MAEVGLRRKHQSKQMSDYDSDDQSACETTRLIDPGMAVSHISDSEPEYCLSVEEDFIYRRLGAPELREQVGESFLRKTIVLAIG